MATHLVVAIIGPARDVSARLRSELTAAGVHRIEVLNRDLVRLSSYVTADETIDAVADVERRLVGVLDGTPIQLITATPADTG